MTRHPYLFGGAAIVPDNFYHFIFESRILERGLETFVHFTRTTTAGRLRIHRVEIGIDPFAPVVVERIGAFHAIGAPKQHENKGVGGNDHGFRISSLSIAAPNPVV